MKKDITVECTDCGLPLTVRCGYDIPYNGSINDTVFYIYEVNGRCDCSLIPVKTRSLILEKLDKEYV